MLTKNFGLDKAHDREAAEECAVHFPRGSSEITGGGQSSRRRPQCANAHSVHLQDGIDGRPSSRTQGGEARIVDSRNFPAAKNIAAALLTIKPGGMRELHWHPNASEWQYYISGKGRFTVFSPVGQARTVDVNANDVGLFRPMRGITSRTPVIRTWWPWRCSPRMNFRTCR